MPDDEPEIVTPTQRVSDLRDVLVEFNALLRQYGPAIEQFNRNVASGKGGSGKMGVLDHLGQALNGGKFDPIVREIAEALRPTTRRRRTR